MKNVILVFGFVFFLFSCGETKKYEEISQIKEEQPNPKEEILEDKNYIEISEGKINYKELKPFFLFEKETSIDSVYAVLNRRGEYNMSGLKEINYKFEGGEYYYSYYILGTFLYKSQEFYVFHEFGESCGVYNGILFRSLKDNSKFISIKGGIGDGDVYSMDFQTFSEGEDLVYRTIREEKLFETEEEEEKSPYKYLVEIEEGYWIVEDELLKTQSSLVEKYIKIVNEEYDSIGTEIYQEN